MKFQCYWVLNLFQAVLKTETRKDLSQKLECLFEGFQKAKLLACGDLLYGEHKSKLHSPLSLKMFTYGISWGNFEINLWERTNSLKSSTMHKKTDLSHMEKAGFFWYLNMPSLIMLIMGHTEGKQRPNNQAFTLGPFWILKFFWKNLN